MKQINWSDHILNFLAVIIGVSLAFYISDTAESRAERREINKILNSLNDELEFEIGIYENNQISLNKKHSALIGEVIEMIENGERDSLGIKFKKCLTYSGYSPRNVTFNSIAASGKLDLITDFELKKKLSFYHEIIAAEVDFQVNNQIDFATEKLFPWVMKNTDYRNPDPADLNDQEIINLLAFYQSLINTKVSRYEELLDVARDLQSNLQNYLNE